MNRIRGLLTTVCFVALSAVAVAATVQTIAIGLPKPLASNASVLIEALAVEDVSSEPRQAKLRLGQRVQRELQANLAWQNDLVALDDAQRQRLTENVVLLAREAFDHKVERYFEIPAGRRRDRYLDRQIDELMNWAIIVDQASQSEKEAVVGRIALPNLLSRMGQSYRHATPAEISRLQQFQKALQDRIVEGVKRRFRFDGG